MNPEMIAMTQALVDFLAWFLLPFAIFLTVEWLLGLFRHD